MRSGSFCWSRPCTEIVTFVHKPVNSRTALNWLPILVIAIAPLGATGYHDSLPCVKASLAADGARGLIADPSGGPTILAGAQCSLRPGVVMSLPSATVSAAMTFATADSRPSMIGILPSSHGLVGRASPPAEHSSSLIFRQRGLALQCEHQRPLGCCRAHPDTFFAINLWHQFGSLKIANCNGFYDTVIMCIEIAWNSTRCPTPNSPNAAARTKPGKTPFISACPRSCGSLLSRERPEIWTLIDGGGRASAQARFRMGSHQARHRRNEA